MVLVAARSVEWFGRRALDRASVGGSGGVVLMRRRVAMGLAGFALSLGAAGCPAFLSDDWRIVSSDASVPDGARANVTGPDAGDAISPPDTSGTGDSLSVDGRAGDRVEVDAALDALESVEAASVDAPIMLADGATCTSFPADAGYPEPPNCADHGPGILHPPAYLWAVAPWGCSYGLMDQDFSNTPVECQCQETYNCACVLAHKEAGGAPNLCGSATSPPVDYGCTETAGVPALQCPR